MRIPAVLVPGIGRNGELDEVNELPASGDVIPGVSQILPFSGDPGEYSITFSLSSGDEYDGSFVIEYKLCLCSE